MFNIFIGVIFEFDDQVCKYQLAFTLIMSSRYQTPDKGKIAGRFQVIGFFAAALQLTEFFFENQLTFLNPKITSMSVLLFFYLLRSSPEASKP